MHERGHQYDVVAAASACDGRQNGAVLILSQSGAVC